MIWILLYLWLMGVAQSYYLCGVGVLMAVFWPFTMPLYLGFGAITWALDWWNRDD